MPALLNEQIILSKFIDDLMDLPFSAIEALMKHIAEQSQEFKPELMFVIELAEQCRDDLYDARWHK